MTRLPSFSLLISGLLLGVTSSSAVNGKDVAVSKIPPFVLIHACPQWATARGHQDYYRYNFDRPFFLGDESGNIWQLRTMLREVPDSVFGTYLFVQNTDRLDRLTGLFEKYLEAAKSVEGAAVVPIVHAIGPAEERPEKLKMLVEELFKRYREHPSWYRINGLPVMVDYTAGGLRDGGIVKIITDLREEGHRFIWLSHDPGGVSFAVNGRVDNKRIDTTLQAADGVYNFAAPLEQGLDGIADLAAAVRNTPGKAYGAGFNPGYYASRLNARNYISLQGTWRLRQVFEKIVDTKPDFLHVATWNDWVEATSFEPSYKHTTALLEIVRHYTDLIYNRPPPASDKPHVIVSYRKNIFPGEPLDFEILNLPVAPGYESVTGSLTLRDASGGVLATLPWGPISGRRAEAKTVTWTVPGTSGRGMLRPEVTVNTTGFRQTYRQLAPVPVVTNSVQADMLYFNVPLHRLRTDAQPVLLVNGRPGRQPSLPGPRLLEIAPGSAAAAGTTVAGVSYLKNGHIINDPTPDTASRAVIENWLSDPLHTGMVAHDYYGALVGYSDGTVAYATGQWAADSAWPDTVASYQFELESAFPRKKVGRDKLIDTSGHALHGSLGSSDKSGRPAWVNLSDRWDALAFNGKNTFVDFPLSSMPAGPVTVQILLRPDEKPGRQQEIFMQRGANLSLRITTAGRFEARRLNTGRNFDIAAGSTVLKSGQWYHITATYDMTRLRLYIDGVEEASMLSDGLRSPEQIRLGGPLGEAENDAIIDRTRGDSWFKGRIAYLRILNGAASSDSIVGDHQELATLLKAIRQ